MIRGAVRKRIKNSKFLSVISIPIFGRSIASSQIGRASRQKTKYVNGKSFISGKTKNIVVHHGFDVTTYWFFSASSWNLFLMTEEEHKMYHKWKGGTQVSCTPLSLYFWAYFIYYRRVGYSLILLILIIGACYAQLCNIV